MLRADILSWHHPSLINCKYANHSVASKAFQNTWFEWGWGASDTLTVCFLPHLATGVRRLIYVIRRSSGWHRFRFMRFFHSVVCLMQCVGRRHNGTVASLCDPQIENSHLSRSSQNIRKVEREAGKQLNVYAPSLSQRALWVVCIHEEISWNLK